MNSIRLRLLFSICLGLLAVFLISGVSLYLYLYHVMESNFDKALLTKAETFAHTTEEQADGTFDFEFLESSLPEYWPNRKAEYYQVWRENGESLARSPSLGDRDLPSHGPGNAPPAFRDLTLPDGRLGRSVALEFVPHAGEGNARPLQRLTLTLAVSRVDLDRALARVAKGLFFTGVALIVGAFFAVWWSLRRDLVSLQRLAEQANAIEADNLSYRFQTESLPRELLPICWRLNNLLERLEAAFNRERRFTADAAHELRTPIAELRTLAEVGLAETAPKHSDLRGYFEDALDIARHLENLVTTLLALTRCEAGLQPVDRQCVDAVEILGELWNAYSNEAEDKELVVMNALAGNVPIATDVPLFKALIGNLFSNAVAYTPRGGEIRLAIAQEDHWVRITVANTNCDLESGDLAHLFDPFWRKQQGKANTQHCGVGLSLVAAYAKVLNILVEARLPVKDVFQMELRCPSFAVLPHGALR
jgi:two-component system sensor histidine kinase QseC